MKLSFKTKLGLAKRGFVAVMSRSRYVIGAIFVAILMASLIIWLLNLNLLAYIFFEAPIGLVRKLNFLWYGFSALFRSYDNALSLGVIVVSILTGINTALLVFQMRRKSKQRRATTGSVVAYGIAIASGGCVACGTSLLAPLFATFGATSTIAVLEIGAYMLVFSSLLLIYSIYKLAIASAPAKT